MEPEFIAVLVAVGFFLGFIFERLPARKSKKQLNK